MTTPSPLPLSAAELFDWFDITQGTLKRWLRSGRVTCSSFAEREKHHRQTDREKAEQTTAPVSSALPDQEHRRPQRRPRRCQHCGTGCISRPRFLCWSCYYAPGVRERYGPVSKYGRRGIGNFVGQGAACEPTAAPPGSPEKIRALMQRVRSRQALWHPGDAPNGGAAGGIAAEQVCA